MSAGRSGAGCGICPVLPAAAMQARRLQQNLVLACSGPRGLVKPAWLFVRELQRKRWRSAGFCGRAAAAEVAALGPGDGCSFHSIIIIIIIIINLRLACRSEKINGKNRPCRVPTSSEGAGLLKVRRSRPLQWVSWGGGELLGRGSRRDSRAGGC